MQPQVHNHYLNTIKRLLGASFVGWVNEKDKKYLKVNINNQNITLPFEGGDVISEESYKDLIKNIIGQYGHGNKMQEPLPILEEERGTATITT
jgi:hypothetical protein